MNKQEHHFIHKDCVKSYELGKKQGALLQSKKLFKLVFGLDFKYVNDAINDWRVQTSTKQEMQVFINEIKELKEGAKEK